MWMCGYTVTVLLFCIHFISSLRVPYGTATFQFIFKMHVNDLFKQLLCFFFFFFCSVGWFVSKISNYVFSCECFVTVILWNPFFLFQRHYLQNL